MQIEQCKKWFLGFPTKNCTSPSSFLQPSMEANIYQIGKRFRVLTRSFFLFPSFVLDNIFLV